MTVVKWTLCRTVIGNVILSSSGKLCINNKTDGIKIIIVVVIGAIIITSCFWKLETTRAHPSLQGGGGVTEILVRQEGFAPSAINELSVPPEMVNGPNVLTVL